MMLSDKASMWVIFLINPFIAMFMSFKAYKLPQSKNFFWAFCVFFGLTFAIGKESSHADINRYVAQLKYLYNLHDYSINDIIIYFQASGEVDVLNIFLSYLVSRFTGSQAALTTVYAIVFGFFYSRNIWNVLNLLKGKISVLAKIFILCLILLVPIWLLNGFRMWTAFHVFMFGLLPYIFENKKSKLIWVGMSFLVHFSFIVPMTLVLIYSLVGDKLNLFFIGFLLSIFISNINIDLINSYVDKYAPQSIAERSEGYREGGTVSNNSSEGKVWYVYWNQKLIKWSFYICIMYFFLYAKKNIKRSDQWKRLFSLSLIFFTAGNFLSTIPSGVRFLNFAYFLMFIMMILYLNQYKEDFKFKQLALALVPAFVLFIIVSVRIGLYSTSITTIIGNPFIALFIAGETTSLNDLIK